MKTCRWMARPLAGSIAFLGAVVLAGNALAQEHWGGSVSAVTVHYTDLNISTKADAVTLYRRIQNAAHVVCGDDGHELGLDARRHADSCEASVMNDAVEKVHSPLLNALHRKNAAETRVTAMLAH